MKIAFLSEHYPPTDGGVATSTQRVGRALVVSGANVHVFCFDHSRDMAADDYCIHEIDQGVSVCRIGPFFLKQRQSVESIPEKHKAILRRRFFAQVLREVNASYDLVLSFYILNAGFMAQMLANEHSLPHIAGVRGNDIGRNIFNVERFAVVQWVLGSADRVACVNEHLRRRSLLLNRELQERTVVIPNAADPALCVRVDPDAKRRLARHTGWNASDLTLAFIGTLREKKGAVPLLRAVEACIPHAKVHLLVIGPPLHGMERELGGDVWDRLVGASRLFCTDRIPRDEVAAWAQGADCVIMASLDDGMANGVLEGMALGLCPVVSNVFNDVVVDGITGVIAPAGDAAALAALLLELARKPDEVRRMGDAARASRSKYTPAHEAAAYARLMSTLVGRTHV